MKTYEAMYLLDAGTPDFEAASAPVRETLQRIGAEVLVLKPWDERRLAYEIKGRKRALYVLVYFKADPAQMHNLEHEIHLDERIVRAMILSADDIKPETMNAETPATVATRHAEENAAAVAAAAAAAPAVPTVPGAAPVVAAPVAAVAPEAPVVPAAPEVAPSVEEAKE